MFPKWQYVVIQGGNKYIGITLNSVQTNFYQNRKIFFQPMVGDFLQYLLIVLIFYFLFFRLKWSEKKVFIAMLVVMIGFELLWQNSLLLTSYGAALLISIWGSVTFIPFWVVNKSIREHKWQVIYYSLWILVAIIMGLLLYFKK